jgi:hypothetical protein
VDNCRIHGDVLAPVHIAIVAKVRTRRSESDPPEGLMAGLRGCRAPGSTGEDAQSGPGTCHSPSKIDRIPRAGPKVRRAGSERAMRERVKGGGGEAPRTKTKANSPGTSQRRVGAPGWTRTSGPELRRLVLYPTELRARSTNSTVFARRTPTTLPAPAAIVQ